MGLDQYLHAKCFTSPSDFWGKDTNELFSTLSTLDGVKEVIDDYLPSVSLEVKVAQWRKSNQVHQWFVDNVQDGKDDCKQYHVSRLELTELRDLCVSVLADHSLAKELLPSTDGFFYGSTDYDEYYFQDLTFTAERLSEILGKIPEYNEAKPLMWDFYYSSSW